MTDRVIATDAALELIELLKEQAWAHYVPPIGRLL